METLKEYVTKRLDRYSLDDQSTIKLVLFYYKADKVSVKEYCKNILNVEFEDTNSKDIINNMVSLCPIGNLVLGRKDKFMASPKIKNLSYKTDFNRDEIYE